MDSPAHESFHADPLQEEQQRLDSVLQAIDRQLQHLRTVPRYFNEDTSEPQTADEVAQQAVDVIRDEQMRMLTAARSEPYFGRLDFQADGSPAPMPLYIGKRGIQDEASGERLVIDWRAPIASMFYSFNGQGDTAAYESPDGPISGQVFLKRNIVVRNRELQRVVDSFVRGQENLNVTDEFLLYRLSENKDNRLRDIVSTIQAEQDRIIRADRNKAIVIQGVAGSGKTTVALHRLAYLLYQYKDKLRTDRMVIFAPNAMFVDYIADVLPELGVGGIRQTTFAQWALEVLDQSVALNDPSERMSRWFGLAERPDAAAEFQSSLFKGSFEFARDLDKALAELESTAVPAGDFTAWEGKVLPESTIRQWFYEDYRHYPLLQRRERVLARVKRWFEIEYKDVKENDKNGALKKQASQRFRSYAAKWPSISPMEVYRQVLKTARRGVSLKAAEPDKGKRPRVDVEDLAPLLYLHSRLNGIDSRHLFDHVVIDEAQDFSPLQIVVLQQYCPSQSFTILGDLSQSIHTYHGITDWQAFLGLFDPQQAEYFQLDVSYRSTMEIIEFANAIIQPFPGFTLAKPVFRSGEPVKVERVPEARRMEKAVEAVRALRAEANTVAVVCRTQEDCIEAHRALSRAGIDANLIDAKQQTYSGGISVLPVYLTKGLEFDAVLLLDVNAHNYQHSPLSAKLLYVGCTRALHKLWLQYSEPMSPLLSQATSSAAS